MFYVELCDVLIIKFMFDFVLVFIEEQSLLFFRVYYFVIIIIIVIYFDIFGLYYDEVYVNKIKFLFVFFELCLKYFVYFSI